MVIGKVELVWTKPLGGIYYRTCFKAPEAASKACAGQFIMLRLTENNDPLLGRPLGIAAADRAQGTIDVIYQVVGVGTKMLSAMAAGTSLFMAGPLGNGFTVKEAWQRAVLVAGGVGIAPLLFLAAELRRRHIEATVLLGAATSSDLLAVDDLREMGAGLHIFTDDGSAGTKGFPTDKLPELLGSGYDIVYACGPNALLQVAAAQACQMNVPCQVSLDKRMACGVGICLCCVCDTKRADGVRRKERVCYEGPVFDGNEVVWHE